MPGHVGIILDGNRRHARALNITDPDAIYNLGADKLKDVLEWCADLGIKTVTLWVLSTDNLKRSPEEMSSILAAIERRMRELAEEPEIHRRKVKVRASGRLDVLPASVAEAIAAAIGRHKNYDAMCINIAVAYGGREEIIDAMRKLLVEKDEPRQNLPQRRPRTHAGRYRPASVLRGSSGTGSHHQNERRSAAIGISSLAKRLQRILFFRRVLAGFSKD